MKMEGVIQQRTGDRQAVCERTLVEKGQTVMGSIVEYCIVLY